MQFVFKLYHLLPSKQVLFWERLNFVYKQGLYAAIGKKYRFCKWI